MTTYQEGGKEAGTIGQIIDQRFDVTQAHIVDVENSLWNHRDSIGSQIRLIDQRISRTVDQLEGRINDVDKHARHDRTNIVNRVHAAEQDISRLQAVAIWLGIGLLVLAVILTVVAAG